MHKPLHEPVECTAARFSESRTVSTFHQRCSALMLVSSRVLKGHERESASSGEDLARF
jgi:hypothetical protein